VALTSGTRLGAYEVLAAIGAGGMGEVYRARDTTLNRDVALKVLPEAFILDPDRLARFKREAQVLASLNHPNIAAIYGFEGSNDGQALVLELVEGPTLADRLAHGPIPIDEALPIARQIAEALEAAHEQGIIHRDLKPANIKLKVRGAPSPRTEDDRFERRLSATDVADCTVKVLDFGLAKALEPVAVTGGDVTASPTITSPAHLRPGYGGQAMTQMGMILGTAAYMSPEQAKGRPADKRSDVWAFGGVLYEMLSGQRAFRGDDISDTLAAVLRQDIDWTALPASTPAPVRRLLARCLDRDVRRRLRDIGEARIVLDDPAALARGDAADMAALAPPQPLWRRAMPVVLVAIVTGALAGAAAWYLKPRPTLAVTRFAFTLPEGQAFSGAAGVRHLIAVSPDGAQVVYGAPARLYLRSMSQLDVKTIQGTEAYQAVTEPVFSPDGRSVAFFAFADQTIKRITLTGGPAVTICPADNPYGISWGPQGIVFGQGPKGIMRVSPSGGTAEVLVRVKDGEEADGPQLLPGGQHVLFSLATGGALDRWDKARVVVQSVTSGERKTLIDGGSDARYVPTGHIVYALGGRVFAVAFDVQRLEVKGEPVPMVEGVRRAAGSVTGAAHYSFSNTGSLVYISGPVSTSSALLDIALTDRKGGVERLELPPGPYLTPRVSPDGARIAFGTDDGKESIVWIYDRSGTTAKRRLTFGGNNRFPIWSADGTRVAFQSDRDSDLAIFWQPADGGAAERLTKPNQGESHAPESWSPKGDTLLFSVRKGPDESLSTLSVQDRKVTPFGDVRSSTLTGALFSPEGRWVAYTSSERGTTTIYVQPFPATGAKHQLFAKEGDSPHMALWSPSGKELFYDPRAGGFEAVAVTTQPTFAFGNPLAVPHPFQLGPASARRTYDMTPSGKFVGLIPAGQPEYFTPIAPQIQVVLNWFEELRARVPPAK
jgi:eukaryotic-like serine/threonine-protein kinase